MIIIKYKNFFNKNNINKKYKYYFLVGNNNYCKNICKIKIIKKYFTTENVKKYYFIIDKKFKWNKINKNINNISLLYKYKLFVLNFIEKINKLKDILNIYINNQHNNNIFFIFNLEFSIYINKISFNNNNIIYINCSNHKESKNYITYNNKYNNMFKFVKFLKKKNIKFIKYLRKLQKDNTPKIMFITMIYNFLKKIKTKKNFFNTLQKYEIKIKKNLNPSWKELEIIILKIINYI